MRPPANQILQQIQFTREQLKRPPRPRRNASELVEVERPLDKAGVKRLVGAPKQRLDTGDEFHQSKGLGEIVVTSCPQSAPGRRGWADPEALVEFGERRQNDPDTGAPFGDGPTYAVSVMQPIEFGGRIALRRAIAERQMTLPASGCSSSTRRWRRACDL